METRLIYCCGCQAAVIAELVTGADVYPHRKDLSELPFWQCKACSNFVGCHHKTKGRTRPLGCIPTPEIKSARSHIHTILDPIWKSGVLARGKVYSIIAEKMGQEDYHTADIKSVEEARRVYRAILDLKAELKEAC